MLRSYLFVTFCFSWLEETRPNVYLVSTVISSGSQMLASWLRITAGIPMMMPTDLGATQGILSFLGIIALFPVVSTRHVLFQLECFKCTISPLKQPVNQRLQWCRTLQLIKKKCRSQSISSVWSPPFPFPSYCFPPLLSPHFLPFYTFPLLSLFFISPSLSSPLLSIPFF